MVDYAKIQHGQDPLRLANSIGLMDAGYRGEASVMLDNIKREAYTIKKGERLVQAVAFDGQPFRLDFVNNLDATQRGEASFGSTNISAAAPEDAVHCIGGWCTHNTPRDGTYEKFTPRSCQGLQARLPKGATWTGRRNQ